MARICIREISVSRGWMDKLPCFTCQIKCAESVAAPSQRFHYFHFHLDQAYPLRRSASISDTSYLMTPWRPLKVGRFANLVLAYVRSALANRPVPLGFARLRRTKPRGTGVGTPNCVVRQNAPVGGKPRPEKLF